MASFFSLFGGSRASRRRPRRAMVFEGAALEPRRYLTAGVATPVAEVAPMPAGATTAIDPAADPTPTPAPTPAPAPDPAPPADPDPVTIPPLLGDVSW